MKLRHLQNKDVPGMLEWMHDPEINCFFRFNAAEMEKEDVERFVKQANSGDNNRHYAIAGEKDEYLGTISLKNIDAKDKNAEYAVVLRNCAIGTGIAKFATRRILDIAFKELNLEKVYLNVYEGNARARRFYEKMGFQYEGCFKRHIWVREKFENLCWYAIFREDIDEKRSADDRI